MTDAKRTELRKFGITMAVALSLVFGLVLPWIFARPYPRWPWAAAAVFLFFGLVLPGGLSFVHWIWMKFATVLGAINSRILLAVVFFLIFLPIGLLRRKLGGDPMARKWDPNLKTYRITPELLNQSNNMERPF